MTVEIVNGIFDVHEKVQQFARTIEQTNRIGAMSMFVGYMRDFNDGDNVSEMFLEHYPGMTETQLQNIVTDAGQRHDLIETFIVHRVGRILPSEPIVVVAVWTSHRGDAFAACREIMEALKSKAPFWKQETLSKADDDDESKRWVEQNTPP